MNSRILTMTAGAAVLVTFALTGCNNKSETASGTPEVVSQAEQKAKELGAEASKGMEQAKEATKEMAQEVKEAGKAAGNQIADKVSDAVITTSVKAEIVKDASLSALKIDVDTAAGRVVLQGTAPTPRARDQATTLARGVKGVVSVDNQLKVEAPKS